MSLIAWCPLIGDTIKSKLNNPLIISPSAPTAGAGGKLGQGFTFNGSSNYIDINNIQLSSEMSFALWFNITTAKTCFIMDARSSSGIGYQPMYYAPGSGIQIFSSTSPTGGYISTGNFEIGTWYHLVVTMKGGNTSLYLNGNHIQTRTLGAATNISTVTIGARYSHAAATMFNGILQDVRIYDHALSVAEIKELAKGLIFHYSFNDRLAESTTNLVSSLKAGGRTTVDNTLGVVTTAGLDQDTYFNLILREALVAGETYTLQCIGKNIPNGEYWTFGISGQASTDPKFSIYNGYNEFTFVATEKNAASTSILFDDTRRTNVWQSQCKFEKFQIEKKDHATYYTKSSRNGGITIDESGNGFDGVQNNIEYTANSASGSLSAKFNGTTSGIQVPFVKPDLMTSDYTLAFWIYPNESQRDTLWGDYNTAGGSQINFERFSSSPYALRIYYGTDRNSDKNIASASIPTGEWTHIAVTYNQTTNTFTVYKNGGKAYDFVYNVSSYTKTSGVFWIGRDSRAQAPQNLKGCISDFKFFATVFTDEDVSNLYKSKAQISEDGDLFAGAFAEGYDDFNVTDKYIVNSKELNEETYQFLDYIENSGTQYIDTGYAWQNETTKLEADIMIITNASNQTLFGNEEYITSSGNSRYFANILHGANGSYGCYIGTGANGSVSIPLGERHLIEYATTENKTFSITIDGTLKKNATYSGSVITKTNAYLTSDVSTNVGNIFVFSNHNSSRGSSNEGSQTISKMRMYRFALYDNGVCVRNLLPCIRLSDNAIGVYDTITGSFYQSASSTAFIAGNIVDTQEVNIYSNGVIKSRQFIEI